METQIASNDAQQRWVTFRVLEMMVDGLSHLCQNHSDIFSVIAEMS